MRTGNLVQVGFHIRMGEFYTNFSVTTLELLMSCKVQPACLIARFLIFGVAYAVYQVQ